jgi:hypothetical protein
MVYPFFIYLYIKVYIKNVIISRPGGYGGFDKMELVGVSIDRRNMEQKNLERRLEITRINTGWSEKVCQICARFGFGKNADREEKESSKGVGKASQKAFFAGIAIGLI